MIEAGMHRKARDEVGCVPAAPICSCESAWTKLLKGGLQSCAACLHAKFETAACSMLCHAAVTCHTDAAEGVCLEAFLGRL